ncbi:MAG TPA: hypothetical protein VFK69_04415 [Candidatus Eisenbacteria bacterium]|nr:hypothetical protein [Candidatus Eisenbacteria bacterium]
MRWCLTRRATARLVAALAVPALALLAPAAARADGAWQTWIRPYGFSGMAVRGDTVWAASREAGLLRYVRSTDAVTRTTRDPVGLASDALTALAFDRSGRLWLGTADAGVSRRSADGRRWDVVSALDGLPGGAVTVLRAVADTMWIGTEQGLALWNGFEVAGALPDGVNPSPFADNHVTGIVAVGDSVWVSTLGGVYVSHLSTQLTEWRPVNTGLSSGPTALAWDGRTLMAVAGEQSYFYNPGDGRWHALSGIGSVESLTDWGGAIFASTLDNGGAQGLYRWDGFTWRLVSPDLGSRTDCAPLYEPCIGVRVAATDPAGDVWVAGKDGLHERRAGDALWTVHPFDTPPGNDLQNVLIDGATVYVDGFQSGVGRLDGAHWRNWPFQACASGCDTTFLAAAYTFAMLADRDGHKWVADWSTAIERFDDSSSPPSFVHETPSDSFPADKHTFAWSAVVDAHNGHWFGMDSNGLDPNPDPIGIEYYDSAGVYRANYNPRSIATMNGIQVRALALDRLNRLWVGYGRAGIDVFQLPDTVAGPLVQVSNGDLSHTLDVFGIAMYGDSVWVMTTQDIRRYFPGNLPQAPQLLELPANPAPRGACHPLDVGPDGSVWVGTTAGLRVYRPNGTQQDFTSQNSPIANDEVRTVRVDPATGVVWLATSTGLSRYDPHYVAPPPSLPAGLSVSLYPNPARITALGIGLRVSGNAASYHGAIVDVAGRVVHRFDAADGAQVWDGRDTHGALVKPGVYFVRLESAGRAVTARVVLLH